MQNWIDCIRSRKQPNAPAEIGYRSAIAVHMSNLSYKTQETHDARRSQGDHAGIRMIGAVDIGGTKIAVGMVDDAGKVLSRMEAPTDPNRYSDGIELIAHMLRKTAQRAGRRTDGDWHRLNGSGGSHARRVW